MTVKEFHEMCTTEIEMYIDRKSRKKFFLDYSENQNGNEFSNGWNTYQSNLEKQVVSVWAMVDYMGKAVLVAEYQ